MLYPVNGSRLFVANVPAGDPGTVPPGEWLEINEAEALGVMGGTFDLEDMTHAESPLFGGVHAYEFAKGMLSQSPIQIILGHDLGDPGQRVLVTAFRSYDSFPFRLVFSDGITSRRWSALVTGLNEVFDTANSIVKLQFDLMPVSAFARSEEK